MGDAADFVFLLPPGEQGVPIYLQLYRRFRTAIATGRLAPGDRVPSVRSLASQLNLARGTVEQAYQLLTSEGYLLARGQAGTLVSPSLAGVNGALPGQGVERRVEARASAQPADPSPFQLGLPALDAFPRKTWVRLAGRRLRNMDTAAMTYPDPCGYEPLRRAIATYLGISRGITCSPEQVFVTAGYRGALDLVCRTLLQAGDSGWFEEPGYRFARQFLEAAGLQLVPVPVDAEGLDIESGCQRAEQARFALVTPTHQSPLGVALSLPRRLALLEWANRRQAWIIEDDYDSEFRYHGHPLPALKSLDREGRVLYAGTFSKVLFPGVCLAYLVVPPGQVERFRQSAALRPSPGAIVLQATVADFMVEGHFARHLRRMRALYAVRRGYLVRALAEVFGEHLQVQPQAGGIALLAGLDRPADDRALAAAANAQGLAVEALGDWWGGTPTRAGLLLGFANLATPEQALAAVRRLQAALHGQV